MHLRKPFWGLPLEEDMATDPDQHCMGTARLQVDGASLQREPV